MIELRIPKIYKVNSYKIVMNLRNFHKYERVMITSNLLTCINAFQRFKELESKYSSNYQKEKSLFSVLLQA